MAGQGMRISGYQRPVDLIEIANRGKQVSTQSKTETGSFKEMFSSELAGNRGVTFSKHASQRMYSRGLELSDDKLSALVNAIDKAEMKGSKETLVLSDEAAFVVSVENRTVVTVFDRENLQDGIVTAIDSAVII